MDSAKVLPPSLVEQIANPPNIESLSPSKRSCPWGNIAAVETACFNDVMSEQLANILQKENESAITSEQFDASFNEAAANSDTCDDFLMAQMLQLQFDREHDQILRREEKKFNGASKVSVSFDKYLRLPNSSQDDDDDDEEDDTAKEYYMEQKAKTHWANFEQAKKALQAVGKSGVSKQGNMTTTKHDITMCSIKNASKLMEFPSDIQTGDGHDMRLSNNVYNMLKSHSKTEHRRSHKVHDKKEKATAESALDSKTRLILYKLVNAGVFEAVNGCISTGKEACIYHAMSPCEGSSSYTEFALKVYKTTLNEFQNRDQYIKDDHRFHDHYSHQNPRKVIHMWAEKEMRNLLRIKQANIPCPDAINLKKHVLVMSFIGNDMIPAPKLRDIKVPFEDMMLIYEQTVDIIKALYRECKLVHADFSEYNLLWHDDKVWVIDVSQSVEITHPRALEFLMRDCRNMCCFFDKQGVIDVVKPEVLFTEVCGKQPEDIENKIINKRKLTLMVNDD